MESTGTRKIVMGDQSALITGSFDLSIYYEDTDLSGYVYHANYLKYFERARSNILGVKLVRDFFKLGAHFVVSGARLKYKRPSHHGDLLTIKTKLEFSESPKTVVYHEVYKENGEKPIVTGEVDLVLVNEKGAPIVPPEFFFEKIKELES